MPKEEYDDGYAGNKAKERRWESGCKGADAEYLIGQDHEIKAKRWLGIKVVHRVSVGVDNPVALLKHLVGVGCVVCLIGLDEMGISKVVEQHVGDEADESGHYYDPGDSDYSFHTLLKAFQLTLRFALSTFQSLNIVSQSRMMDNISIKQII